MSEELVAAVGLEHRWLHCRNPRYKTVMEIGNMTRMLVLEKAVMIKIPFVDLEHLSMSGSRDELDERST